MLLWVLKNWKIIAVAVPLLLLLALVNHWRLKASELDVTNAKLSSCLATAKLTKETNDALQVSRDDVASKLASYKRLHPSTCVVLRSNAKQVGTGPAGGDGAVTGTSDDFRDFAAKCADYRNERIALEKLLSLH